MAICQMIRSIYSDPYELVSATSDTESEHFAQMSLRSLERWSGRSCSVPGHGGNLIMSLISSGRRGGATECLAGLGRVGF